MHYISGKRLITCNNRIIVEINEHYVLNNPRRNIFFNTVFTQNFQFEKWSAYKYFTLFILGHFIQLNYTYLSTVHVLFIYVTGFNLRI